MTAITDHQRDMERRKRINARAESIYDAAVRMMTGLNEQNSLTCEYYQGIEYDGACEFEQLYNEIEAP